MHAAIEKMLHLSVLANGVVNVINTVMSCPRESVENMVRIRIKVLSNSLHSIASIQNSVTSAAESCLFVLCFLWTNKDCQLQLNRYLEPLIDCFYFALNLSL